MINCIISDKVKQASGHARQWNTETKKLDYAHRIAWIKAYGPIPRGFCVCHICDNPPCRNPEHLFLGTKLDNQQDMARKGRSRKQQTCGKGHLMSPNSRGHYCKTCHNQIANRARDKRRCNGND